VTEYTSNSAFSHSRFRLPGSNLFWGLLNEDMVWLSCVRRSLINVSLVVSGLDLSKSLGGCDLRSIWTSLDHGSFAITVYSLASLCKSASESVRNPRVCRSLFMGRLIPGGSKSAVCGEFYFILEVLFSVTVKNDTMGTCDWVRLSSTCAEGCSVIIHAPGSVAR
jgi:hypothetical protein